MNETRQIVLYEARDGEIKLEVSLEDETLWLTQAQMTELFGRDRSVITRHINNVFREGELERESNVHFLHIASSDKPVAVYSLDVIISVGYRVKSREGTQFRIWANRVLKQYLLQGYVENQRRLQQLGQTLQIMQRVQDKLQANQVLDVIRRYEPALSLLDDYDMKRIARPVGRPASHQLSYEECRGIIDRLRFSAESSLFGNEKDDSFHGILGAIEQSFGGQALYPTLEEKAANLLYFIVKDHSFTDGNKRIAAAIFLYYLDKNDALFEDGAKRIADDTLVALIIMLAESKPSEKEAMVSLIMQFLS